jgi:hypothetical protein
VAITLDVADDKLYWTRSPQSTIQIYRNSLDGGDETQLVSTPGRCQGLALLLLPGDGDRDGDVDLDDFNTFMDCRSGPGVLPSPAQTTVQKCLYVFDFDGDQDVDLDDYAAFLRAFSE